jgi:quinol-cytochrome oxidoreductase complex cytochrome b subunit
VGTRPRLHVTSYARAVADADIEADAGSGEPESRKEPLISAEALAGITRALGWLLVIGGAGLVVTGVPLIFVYRPDDPVAGARSDVSWLRGAHSIASMMFVGAVAGTVAVLGMAVVRRLRVPPGWFVALGALAVALVGLISGQLIAWDQLALKSVTAASDARGIVEALSGDVRSVLVDGTEVSRGTYAAWAVVHVLAVPALALGLAWVARRRATHQQPSAAPDAEPAPDSRGPRER